MVIFYCTFWLNSNTVIKQLAKLLKYLWDLLMMVEKYNTHVQIEKQCARKGYMQIESNRMYYNAKVYTHILDVTDEWNNTSWKKERKRKRKKE